MVKRNAIPVEMNEPSDSIAEEELRNVCLVLFAGDHPGSSEPGCRCNRYKDPAHCDRDFAVNLVPVDSETGEFSIEGTGEFAAGGVLELDELIVSLGPHALEPAVLTGTYESEPCELVVAPTEQAARAALSRHRLDQIRPALCELTAEDRKLLVDMLTDRSS